MIALRCAASCACGSGMGVGLGRSGRGGANADDNEANNLGRPRLSISSAPDAVADPLPANVREILAIPEEQRSPGQINAVFSYWRTTVPEWKDANLTIAEVWRQHPEGSRPRGTAGS